MLGSSLPQPLASPDPWARQTRPTNGLPPWRALEAIREAMPPRGTSRYQIGRRIGSGGKGAVFLANDRDGGGRSLAYKVLRRALFEARDGEGYLRQFHREAALTRKVQQPGVPTILDVVDDDDGRPAIVMELLSGDRLDARIQRERAEGLSATALRALLLGLVKVATIIQKAHDQGVIHADLSPSNILIDDRATVWVLDWGSAFALGSDPDPEWSTLGTRGYFDPATLGFPPTIGRDLHGLGSILATILTGSPEGRLRQVPSALRWIVEKARARSAPDGYDSPDAFARDLRRYLRDTSTRAPEPTRSRRGPGAFTVAAR